MRGKREPIKEFRRKGNVRNLHQRKGKTQGKTLQKLTVNTKDEHKTKSKTDLRVSVHCAVPREVIGVQVLQEEAVDILVTRVARSLTVLLYLCSSFPILLIDTFLVSGIDLPL